MAPSPNKPTRLYSVSYRLSQVVVREVDPTFMFTMKGLYDRRGAWDRAREMAGCNLSCNMGNMEIVFFAQDGSRKILVPAVDLEPIYQGAADARASD